MRVVKLSADTGLTLKFGDLAHGENFSTEQRKYFTLVRAWENIVIVNELCFPFFVSNEDLYLVYKKNYEMSSCWFPSHAERWCWNLPMGSCWEVTWVLRKPLKGFYEGLTGLVHKKKLRIIVSSVQFVK